MIAATAICLLAASAQAGGFYKQEPFQATHQAPTQMIHQAPMQTIHQAPLQAPLQTTGQWQAPVGQAPLQTTTQWQAPIQQLHEQINPMQEQYVQEQWSKNLLQDKMVRPVLAEKFVTETPLQGHVQQYVQEQWGKNLLQDKMARPIQSQKLWNEPIRAPVQQYMQDQWNMDQIYKGKNTLQNKMTRPVLGKMTEKIHQAPVQEFIQDQVGKHFLQGKMERPIQSKMTEKLRYEAPIQAQVQQYIQEQSMPIQAPVHQQRWQEQTGTPVQQVWQQMESMQPQTIQHQPLIERAATMQTGQLGQY